MSHSYISEDTLKCSLTKQTEILTLIAMKNIDSNTIFKTQCKGIIVPLFNQELIMKTHGKLEVQRHEFFELELR